MKRFCTTMLTLTALLVAAAACSGGGDSNDTGTPTPIATPETTATPAPPDPDQARDVFHRFENAVLDGDLAGGWMLYTASVAGSTTQHNAEYGCDYTSFTSEFPRMQNLFRRASPFDISVTYGNAPNSPFIEFRLQSADGFEFLATLTRVQPSDPYRVRWLNSGQTASSGGDTAIVPSPSDPQGICGIWTGPR
jgi:hypothetical protein